jgi:hypothetical protein
MSIPRAGRLIASGYPIPTTDEGLLPWSHVEERLTRARNFWLVTVQPDNTPHAVPIWAAWVGGVLYFGGRDTARWVRNLNTNPNAVMHLENGEDVVILKGTVHEEKDRQIVQAVDAVYYGEKYGGAPPDDDPDGGWLGLKPHTALAWTNFPADATRWTFQY